MSDYDTESQGTEMMEVASMRSFSSAGSSKFASKGLQKKLKAVQETDSEQDPNSGARTSRRSRLFSKDHIPTMEELSGEAAKPTQKPKGVPSMKDLIEEAKQGEVVPSMDDLIEEAKRKDAIKPKKTLTKVRRDS